MRRSCVAVAILVVGVSVVRPQSPVPEGAKVEKIAGNFQFVEGPVWNDGLGLLFSDIPANKVYRWTADSGARPYLTPSSNSNGLAYDSHGRLLLAQTGARRIARLESNGSQTPLAVLFNGKKLNSPNDIAVRSTGSIFFTDPPFNVPAGQSRELTFSGIFRIGPAGNLQLLDSSLAEPNGICFSPDESKLYVNNSGQRIIYVWDVVNDSTIANKKQFASINPSGYADGMKVDPQGNVFCSGPLGVWVFSPGGTVLDTILVPGQTANCGWGDQDRRTLYITAGTGVYRIRLATTAIEEDRGELIPPRFQLRQNYPNPFNPTTTIQYTVPAGALSAVSLLVYDVLGREAAALVNEVQSPGTYSVLWDGGSYSSGVYFCRLTTRNHVETNKMVLSK